MVIFSSETLLRHTEEPSYAVFIQTKSLKRDIMSHNIMLLKRTVNVTYINNEYVNIKMSLECLDLLSGFQLVQCAALWFLSVQMQFCPHVDHHIFRTGLHIFHSAAKATGGKHCFYFSIDHCLQQQQTKGSTHRICTFVRLHCGSNTGIFVFKP